MSKLNRIKVSVGINGAVSFLEYFPEEENHADLNQWLDDLAGEFNSEEKPGIYWATMKIIQTPSDWDGEVDASLEIESLVPIDLPL